MAVDSPLGKLTLTSRDGAIVALDFGAGEDGPQTPPLAEAARQLAEYFAGRRQSFDLPLRPAGSAFQLRVWARLLAIPFGATLTYGELARDLGSAPRAVGQACGRNPLPILIPCHRVVAADGLGGFGGPARALDRKRTLLALEGRT